MSRNRAEKIALGIQVGSKKAEKLKACSDPGTGPVWPEHGGKWRPASKGRWFRRAITS